MRADGEQGEGGVRAVVCDDDRVTRAVISDLIVERGGRVLAETDQAFDAIALIERFEPDLVVCDMSLAVGSGMDVIDHLARSTVPCQAVVFTAFVEMTRPVEGVAVRVVSKPDFEHLERALDAAIRDVTEAAVTNERRRPVRLASRPGLRAETGMDDPSEFYRQLADATAGDALLAIPLGSVAPAEVAGALRKAIRVQDLVTQRHEQLIVLLIGGGADGPPAVLSRLARSHPSQAEGAAAVELDPAVKAPAEALLDLPR